jgi:hypothetical protein
MKQKHITAGVRDLKSPEGLWIKSYTVTEDRFQTVYHTRSGVLWRSINNRCSAKIVQHEPWKDCTITFEDYQEFTDWCQPKFGYMQKDRSGRYWALDKDLKIEGNREYSPNTCLFVPISINNLFNIKSDDNGLPVGVSRYKHTDLFQWNCSTVGTGLKRAGTARTAEEGHRSWQRTKIAVIETLLLNNSSYYGIELTNVIENRLEKLKYEFANHIETKHFRFKEYK